MSCVGSVSEVIHVSIELCSVVVYDRDMRLCVCTPVDLVYAEHDPGSCATPIQYEFL